MRVLLADHLILTTPSSPLVMNASFYPMQHLGSSLPSGVLSSATSNGGIGPYIARGRCNLSFLQMTLLHRFSHCGGTSSDRVVEADVLLPLAMSPEQRLTWHIGHCYSPRLSKVMTGPVRCSRP